MPRNIVICSDGTGNTFDKRRSNVSRLIKLLALDNHCTQIAVYDQGIGTNADRLAYVEEYRKSIPDPKALCIVPRPKERRFDPARWPVRAGGLIFGCGLRTNVREMYRKLSVLYESADDKIFLFGFSRGAFTVRALAGLIYRCGLPRKEVMNFDACFNEAWRIYRPHHEPEAKIAEFKNRYGPRDCKIHFLGLWDTVKSYGAVWPISLPHLRHNPIVGIVRHAVALDERRSYFNMTTWGRLDLDAPKMEGPQRRLEPKDYHCQKIEEVWFRGCHSDIGAGVAEDGITLRWMLAEAHKVDLALCEKGKSMLASPYVPAEPPDLQDSWRWWWPLVEFFPRLEIDNSGIYPVKRLTFGSTGRRNPDGLRRDGKISLHTSVGIKIIPG